MGLVVFWLICAGIGAGIGHSKNKTSAGFWWGLLLGPVGLIVIAASQPGDPDAPDTRRDVPWNERTKLPRHDS